MTKYALLEVSGTGWCVRPCKIEHFSLQDSVCQVTLTDPPGGARNDLRMRFRDCPGDVVLPLSDLVDTQHDADEEATRRNWGH